MRRFAVLLCLTLFAQLAQAVDFEVGAGWARYAARGNMMWYQEGMPHQLDLDAPVLEAGLAGNILGYGRFGLDWHAGYVYVGDARSSAIATSDQNYNKAIKGCAAPRCDFQSRFDGHGGIQGARLTLEPFYRYGHWRFGAEVGALVYRPRWNVTVYNRPIETDYQTTHAFHVKGDTAIRVSPALGASVGYDRLSLHYMMYLNASSGAPYHSLSTTVHTLTLRYRF